DGVLIGDIGICLHDNRMQAELGFTVARPYQGQGYGTEAVRCVLDRVFGTGVRRVSADCDARNTASAKLLDRLGFRREGRRVQHTWVKGEWTDDLLFGLLAGDRPSRADEPAIYACRPNVLVRDLSASLRFYRDLLGFRSAGAGPTRPAGSSPRTTRTSPVPRWSSGIVPTSC
ncbi:MAG TPA: GNAT family N-acetyltransferase, partial [Actinophytocola sp.]|uniref:GNAT family N-acetyltransferase n=1 Tax=Actinophytocola sp. TaxID=1872138 RepID=UPI002DBF56B4